VSAPPCGRTSLSARSNWACADRSCQAASRERWRRSALPIWKSACRTI
jgi:hypothetical protein